MLGMFLFVGYITDIKTIATANTEFRAVKIQYYSSYEGKHNFYVQETTCFKSYFFAKIDGMKAGDICTMYGGVGKRKNASGHWEASFNIQSIEVGLSPEAIKALGGNNLPPQPQPAAAPATAPVTPAAPDDDGIPF